MKRMRQFAMAFAAILAVVTIPATAQKTTTTNVTTVIYDYDARGTELLLRSDDYSNESGQATYTSTSSRNSSLTSWIVNGESDLVLYNQSLRTRWINPNDPVGSQPAGPPAGYYRQAVQSDSRFDQNGNTVPLHKAQLATLSACLLLLLYGGRHPLQAQNIGKPNQSSVLLRRASSGDPQAEFALALALERTTVGSPNVDAVTWLRRAAEHGHPIAQTRLADRYVLGVGVEADRNEALHWYMRAASSGYSAAQYGLAKLYLDRGQDQEAIHWLEQAAGRSYHPAEADLGLLYLQGKGVTQDSRRAFAYMRRAAHAHWPLAEYNLAVMYKEGIGTSSNLAAAHSWYRRAEQDGLVCADAAGASPCDQNLPAGIAARSRKPQR